MKQKIGDKMKKTAKTVSVPFTKKQFFSLMKAVYLGNWVANAWRTGEMNLEYEGVEDYIFSLAPQFGLEKYVLHEEGDGDRYFPTLSFEEETDVHLMHEDYDEDTFWDETEQHLGERDFLEKYGKEKIDQMGRNERFTKLYECIDAVNEELAEHGIERLRFEKKKV